MVALFDGGLLELAAQSGRIAWPPGRRKRLRAHSPT
jgi:hypothetical protein